MLHRLFSSSQRGMPTMSKPQGQRANLARDWEHKSSDAVLDLGLIRTAWFKSG